MISTPGIWSGRKSEPCDSYVGNLCGGFGDPCICYICGWERYKHRSSEFDKMFEAGGEELEK